jgi:simple sugar transport system substrate-binding protein
MRVRGVGSKSLLGLLLVALLLSGCGTGGSSKGEYVFGVVLVGPYNDHGWSQAHFTSAEYAQEKLDNVRFVYLDKMNASDRPNTTMEQVVDDMINEGAQMIITTSDDFAADTDTVAAKYPDIPFVHISGDHAKTGEAPGNVANFMGQMEYGKAIAGCAAALKTETKTIGYVGPLTNSETRRLASAAYLGAKYCYETYRGGDPRDLRFVVTWIGFWFNIPGVTLDPTGVSNDLINSGADVLISGIDTTEAIVVAGQRADRGESVWAIPYDFEGACDVKPEICVGTPYFNWGPTYVRLIERAREGKHAPTFEWEAPYWKDINDRDKSVVGFVQGDALTAEQKTTLDEYIAGLASGDVQVYVGPLNYQDGTPFLANGVAATEDEIWNLPQLLEGMEGASS